MQGQKTFKVSKKNLIATLKENRTSHISDYNDAVEGFYEEARIAVKDWAKERIAKTNRTMETALAALEEREDPQTVYIPVNMDRPQSFEESYNEAISLLEFCEDESIEMTQSDHKRYVMDKWDWSQTFETNVANYSNKLGLGKAR